MNRLIAIVLAAAIVPLAARGAPCSGNPDALGTERVLRLVVKTSPQVGRKEFPATLPLRRKELVLTFDDGPWPKTTPMVLAALQHECVLATFFLIGQNVERRPQLARRERAEGHSLGHHTFSHPLLYRLPLTKAEAEIERGIETDERVLYGHPLPAAATRFFRFPGFASSPALLDYDNERGLVVFGADVWASDWNPMTPEQELHLLLKRIDKIGRGIVLLHDTKMQTARMLPAFLRALKLHGYQIVHVVPGPG